MWMKLFPASAKIRTGMVIEEMQVSFKTELGFDEGFPLEESFLTEEKASQEKISKFQGILDSLVDIYHLKDSPRIHDSLKVVFSPENEFRNKKSWGELIQEKGKEYWFSGVRILEGAPEKRQLQAMHHEFRHIWQAARHKNIYEWWLFKNNWRRKQYFFFYHTDFCSIERDAYTFGISLGEKTQEELFEKYDLEWLVRNSNKMLSLVRKAEENSWKAPKNNQELKILIKKSKLVN